MSLIGRVGFDPALPLPFLLALGVMAVCGLGLYLWRRGRAPWLRLAGLSLILFGLAGPVLVREVREASPDIVAVLIDQSDSMRLAGRADAAAALGRKLTELLGTDPSLEVRVREVEHTDDGTPLSAALQSTLADAPRDRIAGAILITDGQVSDPPARPRDLADLGPVHSLIVGDPSRGDRRLRLLASPSFAIVGEPLQIQAVVEDAVSGGAALVTVRLNGQIVSRLQATTGKPFSTGLVLNSRGPSLVSLEVEPTPNEISTINNRAAFEVTGVRDRLRVLLITGEPHPGARTWRNFLKSDPAVDLVHFTILRPVDKNDFDTLPQELALIAFPHKELFDEKLDQFDLIIFDRYRRRGILDYSYFENIARRVEAGGALLVAAGPYDAGADSLNRTPLAAILPSQPTYQLHDKPFRPTPTELGLRHPVLRGLGDPAAWGKWNRSVGAQASGGETLLTANGSPLLVLDHAGKGRVAQLWSDQIWLWARGYDGGGPHAALLRRLAHWLMQEPELEEERLNLHPDRGMLTVERATLQDQPAPVLLHAPNGTSTTVPLVRSSPGVWRGQAEIGAPGLYEAVSGQLRAFAAVGPLNPKEDSNLQATDAALRPLAEASGGAVFFTGESGEASPYVRRVSKTEQAHGSDWLGLRRNGAYSVRSSAAEPLGPGWAWACAGVALLMLAWLREGR